MSLKHLNDEEIQEYLDGNLPAQDLTIIEEHLESCTVCQDSLKQYRYLYDGLVKDEGFELSKDFAKTVLSRIGAEAQTKPHFNYIYALLAFLGAVIGVATIIRFVDLKTLGVAIYETILPRFEFITVFTDSVKNALLILNGNADLVIISGLALAFLATVDRFVLKPKYRRISC